MSYWTYSPPICTRLYRSNCQSSAALPTYRFSLYRLTNEKERPPSGKAWSRPYGFDRYVNCGECALTESALLRSIIPRQFLMLRMKQSSLLYRPFGAGLPSTSYRCSRLLKPYFNGIGEK